MSGVDLSASSVSARTPLNGSRKKTESDCSGSLPSIAKSTAPTSAVMAKAITGERMLMAVEGVARGSSRITGTPRW